MCYKEPRERLHGFIGLFVFFMMSFVHAQEMEDRYIEDE